MRLIIAIDGPAGSGKGTLARRLAAHFDLPYLDTGLLYRAVAAAMLEKGAALEDAELAGSFAKNLKIQELVDSNLRKVKLGEAASIVAAHRQVRSALLDIQRGFATGEKGGVLDGRDIGTVICPEASVKLFVTASPKVRAERRYAEFLARGQKVTFAEILDTINKRDARDSTRADAPLRKAEDALLLDTSNFDIDMAFKAALDMVETALKGKIDPGI
jgi:cytidylate kinase